jgi:hypothetical protein
MWSCIVTCDYIVTCDRASWQVTTSWLVTVHRNMWQCIVTCDRASWHVTVHRDMWPCIVANFLIIKPTRCTNSQIYFGMKLYMFRTVPLSIIRSYSLYTQQWYMSYRFVDSFRTAGSGWNRSSILILLLESCLVFRQLSMNWVPSWSCYSKAVLILDSCRWTEFHPDPATRKLSCF